MPWAAAAVIGVGVGSSLLGSALAPKAPKAPDMSGVINADAQSAQTYAQTSADQLAWAKQQYNDQAPYTKAYLQSMTDNSNAQTKNAQDAQARYVSQYQPIEDQFNKQATTWNSDDRQNQNAGAAEAEVGNAFDAQRTASQQQLESFGIDPSQTRFAALDLGTRVSQAAATAAAGTQSRLNTEATGLALEGEAINVGKGYPSQVAQSYSGATQAGQAGINTATNTAATYGNLMNNTNYANASNSALNNGANAQIGSFGNQLGSWQNSYQASQNLQNQIGKLAGGALGAAGY